MPIGIVIRLFGNGIAFPFSKYLFSYEMFVSRTIKNNMKLYITLLST